jgi:serine/threonine protein kinase
VPDSVPPTQTLEPGTVLDRYELLCTIARGGMAHVWLGRFKGKHGFEKLVAVKTILPEHALDARFRNMFLDEARIASGVEHPNVAKILDLGEWRDCLYLVMEYVDGDSLSRLRRSIEKRGVKLPLPIALRVLADVCAGLHTAHELRGEDGALLNVVHRDVSPQNVLIPTNGVAKLIDFGVAKARHRLGEETSAGFAKGKSRYMSPEQALAKPVDRRSDVFAVGAMAYEVFEGAAPYDGPNDMARLHALITGAEIAEVKRAPHPAIEKLIIKALARDPERRFANANEMRAAIEDAMVILKVRASADDVAAFVVAHTAERIAERKGVVKVALDAAAERQRIKDVLERGTVSGRTNLQSNPDVSPDEAQRPEPSASSPDLGSAPRGESVSPPAFSASVHEDSPIQVERRQRRLWPIFAAAGFFASLLIIVAIAVRQTHATPTSKAPPPPPSTAPLVARPPDTTPSVPSAVASNLAPPEASSATMAAVSAADASAVHHPRTIRKHWTPRHGKKHHEVVIQ